MGHYVNPESRKFQMSLNSKIYVDKSDLIIKTNALLDTEGRFICISRPRRFGKTMAANMLAAYYGIGETTVDLFNDLTIAKHPTYEKHLNQYNVLMINMQEFLSQTNSIEALIDLLKLRITSELRTVHPEVSYTDLDDFILVMKDTYAQTKRPFVILIDEWDCLFREYKHDVEAQKKYLDFLRLWFKDQAYVGLAYMTGILPIKKYGTHSALNMFDEYSMIKPYQFLDFFGFTEEEVLKLSKEYKVDFEEIKKWYNGYFVDRNQPIYNPRSVKSSLLNREFDSYWSSTETYEALKDYINLNFDELKDKVTLLLSDVAVPIITRSFVNDMTTFNSADNILTLLVHLGYLTYNFENGTVRIPNEEIKGEFVTAITSLKWPNIVDALRNSQQLLEAIWGRKEDVIVDLVQKVHEKNTSILQYNDENSLSCVLSLALYSAKDYYTVIRELPSGKGYVDLVFIPLPKHLDKPAMIVELKWDQTTATAIDQIKNKNYISALEGYEENLLLVGINYSKKTKKYDCTIKVLGVDQ